ncbi:MAG: DUF2868 domain-containing protein [Proteobacteria bacterium]|nr:DUF2868 domain-containing protein [Pseudomonadota bacterium]
MKQKLKHIWKYPDIVDLEYFLHETNSETDHRENDSHKKDRDIFLKEIEPFISDIPDGLINRKVIIRRWLDIKRGLSGKDPASYLTEKMTPGNGFKKTLGIMFVLLAITGFLSGAGLAASLLFYTGDQPINVSTFIGLVVAFQIFLIFLLLVVWVTGRFSRFHLVSKIFQTFFLRITTRIGKKALQTLSAEKKGQLTSIMGLINGRRRIYGSLFIWPFFILTQAFGMAFNIGIIAATWFRIIGTDLAFGWQSTLQISSQAVFRIVSVLSIPWAWIVPDHMAHPTLAQIEGSRIILKDGIMHLTTGDMVSWWPFLLFAVVFYGLIPRMTLLMTGVFIGNKSLDALTFDTFDCDKLMMRMTTPVIGEPHHPLQENKQERPASQRLDTAIEKDISDADKLLAIIPDDLINTLNMDDLYGQIYDMIRLTPLKTISSTFDFDSDQKQFTDNEASGLTHIWVLQEGWLPPIKEIYNYFREIRHFFGPEIKIIIFLVGKPVLGTVLTKVEEGHYRIWQQGINSLGDPRISLERTRF